MCGVKAEGRLHRHTYMNEHVVADRVIGAQFAFSPVCIHVSERREKGSGAISRPSSLFP